MLEHDDSDVPRAPLSGDCGTAWDGLECRIQIPRKWLRYFEMQGVLGTVMNDCRRFPRFHCRACAVLHYRRTLPAVPRVEGRYAVLTRDVSREGVCFLHEEELYPCEEMALDLPGGKHMGIRVFRCAKHNDRCFEIGARFTIGSGEPIAD
ncbi:MAG: hypothetical protein A2V70_11625 [Planctomycetes bacterium RBG_13_63_9]|nr:MAG: hypothetical protein A2V70_11625 [Planctomycetes bacterium RBG_13_63_9]